MTDNTMPIRLPHLTNEEAKQLASGPYGQTLLKVVVEYVTPFGIGVPEGAGVKVQSGSAFFLRTPRELMVVTAKHVYEGYLDAKRRHARVGCQLGDVPFDPEERLISTGRDVDVATFRITDPELAKIGKTALTAWPPQIPEEGKGVLFAGFPGAEVTREDLREYVFGVYAGAGVCHRATEHQITTRIQHETLCDPLKLGRPPKPGFDTGGMSGGPMLTIIERGGVVSWRLGGVISEGWATADTIVATRADAFTESGRVIG